MVNYLGLNQEVCISGVSDLPRQHLANASLDIYKLIAPNTDPNEKIERPFQSIADAFLKMCQQTKCPVYRSDRYHFGDDKFSYLAKVNIEQGDGISDQDVGKTCFNIKSVNSIKVSSGARKRLEIIEKPKIKNRDQLVETFEFSGEPYGIGGVDACLQKFVEAFISPRLLSGKLQAQIKSNIPRGGILSGPEVFNKFVGQSEENVRKIFEFDNNDDQIIHLILIDEIDAMLSSRGGSGARGAGDNVVAQFLTLLDGVHKKDNVIVFGTSNRPELIDSAVKRPGRLELNFEFTLPQENQRLQILKIQARGLSDCGMLNSDVDFKDIAKRTAGFTGAELSAVVEKARQSALRRGQGLSETDNFFRPQALSQLETLDVNYQDFKIGLHEVKPQFGKSNFIDLEDRRFGYPGYDGAMVEQLKKKVGDFAKDQEKSSLCLLITGPQGSGKSTLAALVINEFGSLCSYVSASDILMSKDSLRPLMDAFNARNSHKVGTDLRYCVVIGCSA
ncbi:AAA family ATPase [Endozoicomonas ascidiicola]|uniref:AAA family ATPase n=1 Tax=Endozoicomonas ascidiicola TaxID=1698521 RepID=UPI00082AE23B|nr:AAA family ATPase [Endozoicomonas ascidiicola]